MITTPGATVSNTFANALFNWCTMSLPASAGDGFTGTVELGTASGCAANEVLSATHRAKMDKRIGWNFDTTQDATFNPARPIPVSHGESVLWRSYPKTHSQLALSHARFMDGRRTTGSPTSKMRTFQRRFLLRAGVA